MSNNPNDVAVDEEEDNTKYVTSTAFRIGEDNGKIKDVPEGTEFAKIASYFDKDQKAALVASGSLVPMDSVSSEIAEDNEALKEENQSLESKVKELEAQLKAATEGNKTPGNTPPVKP